MRKMVILLGATALLSATAAVSSVLNDLTPYSPSDTADGFWDASGHAGVTVSTAESGAVVGEGADDILDLRTFSQAFSNVVGDFSTMRKVGFAIVIR